MNSIENLTLKEKEKYDSQLLYLASREYIFTINDFEGPIDLLLYFVEKNKMDISNIDIYLIIDQYLEFIRENKKNNLEIASEFIYMASNLIYIKSKKLLPAEQKETEEEENLIDRIIEYKKYKEASQKLNSNYDIYSNRYVKLEENIPFKNKEFNEHYDIKLLEKIYVQTLYKYIYSKNKNLKNIDKIAIREKFSVKDKVKEIFNILKKTKMFIFNKVFSTKRKKGEIIAAFLGLLELSNKDKVQLQQDYNFADIEVREKNV